MSSSTRQGCHTGSRSTVVHFLSDRGDQLSCGQLLNAKTGIQRDQYNQGHAYTSQSEGRTR
ncbi:hypothetical protein NQZ68_003712 [Dissostichus eleginoides]|nr:hypothetical protein NQZ68_003712 [Dissostichus eleginoides]